MTKYYLEIIDKAQATAKEEDREEYQNIAASVSFLNDCFRYLGQNPTVVEKFQCEILNLIQIIGRSHSPRMLCIQTASLQVIETIIRDGCTASMAWYLHHKSMISIALSHLRSQRKAKIVTLLNAQSAITELSESTVLRSVEKHQHLVNSNFSNSVDAARAVSEALGMEDANPVTLSTSGNISTKSQYPVFSCENFEESGGFSASIQAIVSIMVGCARFSPVLLVDFNICHGYDFIGQLIIEASEKNESTLIHELCRMMPLSDDVILTASPKADIAVAARNINAFAVIRDIILQHLCGGGSYVEERKHSHLTLTLLSAVMIIYADNYENFMRLEHHTRMLSSLLEAFPLTRDEEIKSIILQLVEYVCKIRISEHQFSEAIVVRLSSLFIELSKNELQECIQLLYAEGGDGKKNMNCVVSNDSLLISRCMINILSSNLKDNYQQLFLNEQVHEKGLYFLFTKMSTCLEANQISETSTTLCHHYVHLLLMKRFDQWGKLCAKLLQNHGLACIEFRKLEIHFTLYSLMEYDFLFCNDYDAATTTMIGGVGQIFCQLGAIIPKSANNSNSMQHELLYLKNTSNQALLFSGLKEDMTTFLRLLAKLKQNKGYVRTMLDLFKELFLVNQFIQIQWREFAGFQLLISLITPCPKEDAEDDQTEDIINRLQSVFAVLTIVLHDTMGESENRHFFVKESGGYVDLAKKIIAAYTACIFESSIARKLLFELIQNLILGTVDHSQFSSNIDLQMVKNNSSRLCNPAATYLVFAFLSHLPIEFATTQLHELAGIIECNGPKLIKGLLEAGFFNWVIADSLLSCLAADHPLCEPLVRVICAVSREQLPARYLLSLLRLNVKLMPSVHTSIQSATEISSAGVGLKLLKEIATQNIVPYIPVGAPSEIMMNQNNSGYIHVSNSAKGAWPPLAGYSFSCWIKVFKLNSQVYVAPTNSVLSKTTCVALCGGELASQQQNHFWVLDGDNLSSYLDEDHASDLDSKLKSLSVISYQMLDVDHFSFEIKCREENDVIVFCCMNQADYYMWTRALHQISPGLNATGDTAPKNDEEPHLCLISLYSLDGGFCRFYFDGTSGILCAETGSSVDIKRKKMFENVNISMLEIKEESTHATHSSRNASDIANWHHILLTHRRSVMSNSLITLYLNGSEVASMKLAYPSILNPSSMNCYIGNDTDLCCHISTNGQCLAPKKPRSWILGPCWLTQEPLNLTAAATMFLIGPTYTGQFSGKVSNSDECASSFASHFLYNLAIRQISIIKAATILNLRSLLKSTQSEGFKNYRAQVIGDSSSEEAHVLQNFVQNICSMENLGAEMIKQLKSFRLSKEQVVFSLNTVHNNQNNSSSSSTITTDTFWTERVWPLNFPQILPTIGGMRMILFWIETTVQLAKDFHEWLHILRYLVLKDQTNLADFHQLHGPSILLHFIEHNKELLNERTVSALLHLSISGFQSQSSILIDSSNLCSFWLSSRFWSLLMHSQTLKHTMIHNIISLLEPQNPHRVFNARQLRTARFSFWNLYTLKIECERLNKDEENNSTCTSSIVRELGKLLQLFLISESHIDDMNGIFNLIRLNMAAAPSSEMDNVLPASTCCRTLVRILFAGVESKDPSSFKQALIDTIKYNHSRKKSSFSRDAPSSFEKLVNYEANVFDSLWSDLLVYLNKIQSTDASRLCDKDEDDEATMVVRIIFTLLQLSDDFADIIYHPSQFQRLCYAIKLTNSCADNSGLLCQLLMFMCNQSFEQIPLSKSIMFLNQVYAISGEWNKFEPLHKTERQRLNLNQTWIIIESLMQVNVMVESNLSMIWNFITKQFSVPSFASLNCINENAQVAISKSIFIQMDLHIGLHGKKQSFIIWKQLIGNLGKDIGKKDDLLIQSQMECLSLFIDSALEMIDEGCEIIFSLFSLFSNQDDDETSHGFEFFLRVLYKTISRILQSQKVNQLQRNERLFKNLAAICLGLCQRLWFDHSMPIQSGPINLIFLNLLSDLIHFGSSAPDEKDTEWRHIFIVAFIFCMRFLTLKELMNQYRERAGVIVHEYLMNFTKYSSISMWYPGKVVPSLSRRLIVSGNRQEILGRIDEDEDRAFVFSIASETLSLFYQDQEVSISQACTIWKILLSRCPNLMRKLLIVEARTTLFQSLLKYYRVSSRKAVIDFYTNGFDVLLLQTDSAGFINDTDRVMFLDWITTNRSAIESTIAEKVKLVMKQSNERLLSLSISKYISKEVTEDGALTYRKVSFQNAASINEGRTGLEHDNWIKKKKILISQIIDETRHTYHGYSKHLIEQGHKEWNQWCKERSKIWNSRSFWSSMLKDEHYYYHDDQNEVVILSIFQQAKRNYFLDFTEGPCRHRTRLRINNVQQSLWYNKYYQQISTAKLIPQNSQPSPKTHENTTNYYCTKFNMDSYSSEVRHAMLFTDVVEIFKKNVDTTKEENRSSRIQYLDEILQVKSKSMNELQVAQQIYTSFIAKTSSTLVPLSKHSYKEITKNILDVDRSSSSNSNVDLYQIFDNARAEAVQFISSITNTEKEEEDFFRESLGRSSVSRSSASSYDESGLTKALDVGNVERAQDFQSINLMDEYEMDSYGEISLDAASNSSMPTTPHKEPKENNNVSLQDQDQQPERQTSSLSTYDAIMDQLELTDRIPLRSYNCVSIAGLAKVQGLLVLGPEHMYFIPDFIKIKEDILSINHEEATSTSQTPTEVVGVVVEEKPPSPSSASKRSNMTKLRAKLNDLKDHLVTLAQEYDDHGHVVVPCDKIQHGLVIAEQLSLVDESLGLWSLNSFGLVQEKKKINYYSVKEFYRMKYQLNPVAIEFFSNTGENFFINFGSQAIREEVFRFMFSMPIINSVFRPHVIKSGALTLSMSKLRQSVTRKWMKGKISNFEYLIRLNTFAGRSFNDLTQYPIFPWILQNYTGDTLDLGNPSTFRDLSKPMGAIGQSRAALFQERFEAMQDDFDHDASATMMTNSKPFHYGTHYSCSAYVLHFLVRLEPYSTMATELQVSIRIDIIHHL